MLVNTKFAQSAWCLHWSNMRVVLIWIIQQGCGMLFLFILFLCARMSSRPLFRPTDTAVRTISSQSKASVYILADSFRLSSLFGFLVGAKTAAARREVAACLVIEGKYIARRLELMRGSENVLFRNLRNRVLMCYTVCFFTSRWQVLESAETVCHRVLSCCWQTLCSINGVLLCEAVSVELSVAVTMFYFVWQ